MVQSPPKHNRIAVRHLAASQRADAQERFLGELSRRRAVSSVDAQVLYVATATMA